MECNCEAFEDYVVAEGKKLLPSISIVIFPECAVGVGVYLWLEEVFLVIAHVSSNSEFEEMSNLSAHDE